MFLGTPKKTQVTGKIEIPYKIFKIPDTTSLTNLFLDNKLLWNYKNQGQDKFSIINKTLNPGEAYFLNIGIVLDLYADKTKIYDNIFFICELRFSNNQKIPFGASATIIY